MLKFPSAMKWNDQFGKGMAFSLYFFKARHRKGHGVHSPFIFDFIIRVLNDKTWYNGYEIAEKYRKSLLRNRSRIVVTDFGAGSHAGDSQTRSFADIARYASVNHKFGRLLYRIAMHFKPELIIELGTSLGIGTHYLACGNPEASVFTIEADPALAGIASENLLHHKIENVRLINNTFDSVLPVLLPESPKKTLVFVDGNHSRHATLKYADFFFSKLPDGSILIFDDINWSAGMQNAWKEIRNKNALTVDLFRMGIVFMKHDFFKENYTIRF